MVNTKLKLSIGGDIVKVIHGIRVYEKGEKVFFETEMPPIPEYMYSKFGWKIIEIDGKNYWAPMEEEEYIHIVAKYLGISPSEVDLNLVHCGTMGDNGCFGDCTGNRFCKRWSTGDSTGCICGA